MFSRTAKLGCQAVAGLLAFALPAAAASRPLVRDLPSEKSVCWERVYDAAHLAANPTQKTLTVRLQSAIFDNGAANNASVSTMVSFTFRDFGKRNQGYRNMGYCRAQGDGLSCPSDWGRAGRWSIRKSGDELVLTAHGLALNPDTYDAEELAPDALRLPAGGADRVWKLRRVADAACK